MTEADFFGYTFTRPPNNAVAGIIEDYQVRNLPVDVLSSMYHLDDLTIRLVILDVLYPKFKNPVTIVRKSKV